MVGLGAGAGSAATGTRSDAAPGVRFLGRSLGPPEAGSRSEDGRSRPRSGPCLSRVGPAELGGFRAFMPAHRSTSSDGRPSLISR